MAVRFSVTRLDGGLFALADATNALNINRDAIRVVSISVGEYPPKGGFFNLSRWLRYLFTVRLLQKQFEINTRSMDQLRLVLFAAIATVRVNDAFTHPSMATDMFEHSAHKLDLLWQRGRASFAPHEQKLREFLL
jgi:uncharacterized protein